MEFISKLVFFVAGFLFAFNGQNYTHFDSVFKDLFNFQSISVSNYVDSLIEEYGNEDIVGNIRIDSLSINTPIVQYSDNEYYLNHNEYNNESRLGAIFLDYRNSLDLDRKILIFGHNSQSITTLFQGLERYLNESFFKNEVNRTLVINTGYKRMEYLVSSVFVVSTDFQHMKLSFDEEEWKRHIDWINESSLYSVDKISYEDEILIMQTCYYEPKNSYLLVIAKKIKEAYY